MGHTYGTVKLGSNAKQLEKRLLVDTGSTYSWIKSADLKRLGVRPIREQDFETIEGRVVRKKVGEVLAECLGNRAHTLVVFAGRRDAEVLGLHALEGMALEVDPVRQKLKRSRVLKALF
jgi:predicted aspartyl protease